MSRFLIRAAAAEGGHVAFDAAETRHLSRVLRLGPGDLVVAVDGRGQEWTVRLTEVGPRAAAGVVLSGQRGGRESPLRLTLVQGVPKADKMDLIVRMATELGAVRVVPVICERTVIRAGAHRFAGRTSRWQRIARESAKQCGRAVVPDVDAPRDLAAWLQDGEARDLLVCLREGEAASLADRLPSPPILRATLVVGPEGGLAEREAAALSAAGAVLAGLGPRILRTETAGPIGLALLQARYGDLGAARGADG